MPGLFQSVMTAVRPRPGATKAEIRKGGATAVLVGLGCGSLVLLVGLVGLVFFLSSL